MMQYDTIWYNVIQYHTIWNNMIQYDIIWHNMIQYDTIWHNMIQIWYDVTQYDTIWYNMTQYDTIWYNMIQYDTIWHNLIQYYDAIYKYFFCARVITRCNQLNQVIDSQSLSVFKNILDKCDMSRWVIYGQRFNITLMALSIYWCYRTWWVIWWIYF